MSKEKKLKRYAENRLSSFANGEDSLTRLKKEQALNAPREEKPVRKPFLLKKAAVAFSAVVVIAVVAVCLVRFSPFDGRKKAYLTANHSSYNGSSKSTADESAGKSNFSPSPNGGAKPDSEGDAVSMTTEEILAELNGLTEYLKVTLPSGASLLKSDSGKRYEIRLYDSGRLLFAAGVDFEEGDAEVFVSGNRQASVGEQTFVYKEDRAGVWQGQIVTEKEIVSVVYCVSESEEGFLGMVRSVFSKK